LPFFCCKGKAHFWHEQFVERMEKKMEKIISILSKKEIA
jgi:hypothetical protein